MTITLAILSGTASMGHATVRNYFHPELNGTRLDSCLAGQNNCGKPAADAFCVAQGFSAALIFQRESAVSTRQAVSDSICEGASCMSFRQIKCISPSKTDSLAQN
jgi:hypothetical protein